MCRMMKLKKVLMFVMNSLMNIWKKINNFANICNKNDLSQSVSIFFKEGKIYFVSIYFVI